ncbi:hypothetical protein KUW09_22785 [Mameliella alba]|nr:hypothetical protein [Mameliella alba]MCA0956782.1 hypothetical protein [Mameliella alba]
MTKAGLLLLAVMILLGNGLRSVVTSSIFMSEASFASFLSITVESTAAVTELLMGAVLVSLLAAPWLMQRVAPITLAIGMAAVAALAALGLAGLFQLRPPVDTRIAGVILLFPLIGFALATLAPISQNWATLGGDRGSRLLLGAWSLAMPLAFLATPQLVRVIAPRYGLDTFFAGFALVTAAMVPVLWLWRSRLTTGQGDSKPVLSGRILAAGLAAVLAFQALTILISLAGLKATGVPYLSVLLIVTLAALWWVSRRQHAGQVTPNRLSPQVMALFAMLFLLNIATTGFYDTSFLVLHSCSNTLIADRATLAGLAQVAAAALATALLARFAVHRLLVVIGVLCAIAGLSLYLAYPGVISLALLPIPEPVLYIGSRAVTGFGTGLATTAAVFALSSQGDRSSGAGLMLAFVVIIGTEAGLELFEVASQIWMMVTGATSAPYGGIFLAQIAFAAAALVPMMVPLGRSAPVGARAA